MLSADDWAQVRGVTSLGEDLYIIHCRCTDQIDVYSMTDFAFLRRFSVPGLSQHGIQDITSCVALGCLLIADSDNRCLHKIMRDDEKRHQIWPLSDEPYGLSKSCCGACVLVACRTIGLTGRLLELNSVGDCVREIELRLWFATLSHAVKIGFGRFVVSYRRFCCARGKSIAIVDEDSRVEQSYGNRWINWGREELTGECHMAVDDDGFVFVADSANNRLLLLNPSLQFVRCITTRNRPRWLHLDQDSRRLFVGHDSNAVSVLQL